jgi:hypothetical protein
MMRTFIVAAVALLYALGSGPAFADDARIVGSWKAVSLIYEDPQTKEQILPFGLHPNGRMVILANGVWIVIATAQDRKPPQTEAERAAALATMTSYTGRYHFEGAQIVTHVEASWQEGQVGTDVVRTYQIDGDRLILTSPAVPNPNLGNKVVRSIVTWQRES